MKRGSGAVRSERKYRRGVRAISQIGEEESGLVVWEHGGVVESKRRRRVLDRNERRGVGLGCAAMKKAW